MKAERTCKGCEWEHNRYLCERYYFEKYGKPCMSDKSIHVLLNQAIERKKQKEQ